MHENTGVLWLNPAPEEGRSGLSATNMNYAKPLVWDEPNCVYHVARFGIIFMLRICILV